MSISNTTKSEEEFDLNSTIRYLVGILLRRRVIALPAFFILMLIGVTLVVRSPKIYEAQSVVRIERKTPAILGQSVQGFESGAGYGYLDATTFYETQYKIINSRLVASKAVTELGLVPDQLANELKSALSESSNSPSDLSALPKPLQKKFQILGIVGPDLDLNKLAESIGELDTINSIRNMIKVTPITDSRLVRIGVEHKDPELAAEIANIVSQSYVDTNLEQKRNAAQDAVSWLSDQVLDIKTKLTESEVTLHQFKDENKILASSLNDRQTILSQRLLHLNQKLSEVDAASILLKSRLKILNESDDSHKDNILNKFSPSAHFEHLQKTLSQTRSKQQEMSQRYTNNHPQMISLQKQLKSAENQLIKETNQVIQAMEQEYQAHLNTARQLKTEIQLVKEESLQSNKKAIDFKRLHRDASNNLALYNLLIKRQKEAELSQMLKANNVHILERARVPAGPIRPRVKLGLLFTLLLSSTVSIGLALCFDLIDNSVKSQDHIENVIGAPFLGLLPAISENDSPVPTKNPDAKTSTQRDLFILDNPRSTVAECSRTIRTNLFFMSPEEPAQSIVVTSNGPQEGKSTVAINLGITIAQSGKKTLLVDADMRRPRLHRSFGVDNDTGLSNLIIGDGKLEDCIHKSRGTELLDVLPCGPIPPNPAELLHSTGFNKILNELQEEYDHILFDSPPVSPVTDALILGSMLNGIVFVAHAGKTKLPAAQQATRRLADVGSRILGVVLNNVDLENRGKSGYYDYQYYYYHRTGYYYDESADNTVATNA